MFSKNIFVPTMLVAALLLGCWLCWACEEASLEDPTRGPVQEFKGSEGSVLRQTQEPGSELVEGELASETAEPVEGESAEGVEGQRSLFGETAQEMRARLMTSVKPVGIHQQGRRFCVSSDTKQYLPIYRADGTFYSAFLLQPGTNWLMGLPPGGYIINNQDFSIR